MRALWAIMYCPQISCSMLLGHGDAHGGHVCVPGVSGVAGLEELGLEHWPTSANDNQEDGKEFRRIRLQRV